MNTRQFYFIVIFFFLTACACNSERTPISEKKVVEQPADLGPTTSDLVRSTLKDAVENGGHVDSFYVNSPSLVQYLYEKNNFQPLWTGDGKWFEKSDSLFNFISNAREYGLFPQDYFLVRLTELRSQTLGDTAARNNKLDASLWAQTELLLTSSFIQVVKDLKAGRLVQDSIIDRDSTMQKEFFLQQLALFKEKSMDSFSTALEPKHKEYYELKNALGNFLADADFKTYTQVNYRDSINLKQALQQRLSEEDSIVFTTPEPDSTALSAAIKKYQKSKGIKQDGKISPSLINSLNQTDTYKFKRIAVTLDRYKMLTQLPQQYIWVNIPGYKLELREGDSVAITSKVVVGKPATRTPLLTSAISDMITYPKWHIPNSIIRNEILPALKKDAGYLARKGYSLWDWKGVEINPYTIDWSQYKKDIPFRIIQGSGDDNALGVIKFNFPNKYSVYLHDTNQRYLFSKEKRALSHGCVRVQSWEKLAYYLLKKDSANVNAVPVDSLQTWLALKEKHVIPLRKRVPLYIRYFSCEGKEGKLIFHEDIYGEDKRLLDQYFAKK